MTSMMQNSGREREQESVSARESGRERADLVLVSNLVGGSIIIGSIIRLATFMQMEGNDIKVPGGA